MSIEIVDFKSSGAAELLVKSLHSSGFAVLTNHGIEAGVFPELYKKWEGFFKSDTKSDFLMGENASSGFVPQSVAEVPRSTGVRDIKEFYDYIESGSCPDSLREITASYYATARSLSLQLLKWLDVAIPAELKSELTLSGALDELVSAGGNVLLRILHYPALRENEERGAVRAAEHADTNFITLLPMATEKGLQVKLADYSWVDVPNIPGAIVINCGDMLSHATQGYYRSAYHRVLNPSAVENKSRISMPMFVHPHTDAVLSSEHTSTSFFKAVAAQVLWEDMRQ
jgi:isopenicillin N synthase-like dioxygenase